MKLNAKALAENEAKKPAAREGNEEGKEDSVVTPIQPPKKPSWPLLFSHKMKRTNQTRLFTNKSVSGQ